MMQLSFPLVLCQCAILFVSLDGIVCPVLLDFVIKNFSKADLFDRVTCEGDNMTGRFIFRKDKLRWNESSRYVVVRVRDISTDTLKQEGNDPRIVSFYLKGKSANYNIRFKSEHHAYRFIRYKVLSLRPHFTIRWARIYTHSGPAIIAYEEFDSGDIGFKLLDNEEYTNEYARLAELPYVFKRSDMRYHVRTSTDRPHTLYLRNDTEMEDYEIVFRSAENMDTFLDLFPDKLYDEHKTLGYYFMPGPNDANTSESHDPAALPDPSGSHDPLDSQETSESQDTTPAE